MTKHPWLIHFTALWLAFVTFIYPIPHTIALRNLMLLIGCITLLIRLKPKPHFPSVPTARAALVILGLLSLWMVVGTLCFGLDAQLSMSLFRGDWVVVLIVMSLGLLAGATIQESNDPAAAASTLVAAIVVTGLIHVVWLLGYQLWIALHGHIPWGHTPFAEKDFHSVIVNFLFALLLAEAVLRKVWQRHFLPFGNRYLFSAIIITSLAVATLLARNTVIVTAVLVTAACIAYAVRTQLLRKPRSAWSGLALVATLTLGLVTWSVGNDNRWSTFLAAATLGTQIDTHRYWLEGDPQLLPHTENGAPVDESAYLRAAWATAALREIARHPLGVGYGHKAFGIAINDHYGLHTTHESSHSGLLDFTLANGVPGLALWLALAGVLMVLGWRAFRTGNPVGLMLFLFVLGYLVRCALDGHLSGWRLESYALTTGLLTALTLRLQKT